MRNKADNEQFEKSLRDPLWWMGSLPALIIVILAALNMTDMIDYSVQPYSAIRGVCFGVLFLSCLVIGIRGTDAESKKPLSTMARVAWIAVGVIGLAIEAAFIFAPGLFN